MPIGGNEVNMPEYTDSTIIKGRIEVVRQIMASQKVDMYIVATGDYHMSEYAGDYFGERQFISGFTGSAGTVVITSDEARLFTDGRYFVQAAAQIKDTGIQLMRSGTAGVPTVKEYCTEECKKLCELGRKPVVVFNGRTFGALEGLELEASISEYQGMINCEFDAVSSIWKDRPAFPHSQAYELDMRYCGMARKEQLSMIRMAMEHDKAEAHVIASLDDICWLFNIRGNDVECNPVIMAYALVTKKEAYLYADDDRFNNSLKNALKSDGVIIKKYDEIYGDLDKIQADGIYVDKNRVNYAMYNCVNKSVRKIEKQNPSVVLKAVKNETEVRNLREIHIEDGLAVTRFMYWLKTQISKGADITEHSAAMYLDNLRSQISDYIELSFPTISAYGPNAAMMHYSASEDNCAKLDKKGMLLVDSGGQYMRGTTDVTRTFALGQVTDQMKKHFTLTLKGMLALTNARFLKGCTGFNLDILARQPLWNEGIDYRCGTGHGIGYLLNVHESPNGFRWKHNPGHNDLCILEPGMVTSNEPGVYIDGEYGIRIENEIICVQDHLNEYGTFLRFDTLTWVPIDLDLVDTAYLDAVDIDRLNQYHEGVYDRLSPYMKGEELEFLRKYTAEVRR